MPSVATAASLANAAGKIFGLFGGPPKRITGAATVIGSTGRTKSKGGKGDSGASAERVARAVRDALKAAADTVGAQLRPKAIAVRTVARGPESPLTLFGSGFGAEPLLDSTTERDLINRGVPILLRDSRFVTGVDAKFKSAVQGASSIDDLVRRVTAANTPPPAPTSTPATASTSRSSSTGTSAPGVAVAQLRPAFNPITVAPAVDDTPQASLAPIALTAAIYFLTKGAA